MAVQEDSRLFERFSARFPIRIKDTRDDFGTNVFLRNASASGMRLTSKERLYLNDHISIEVELPDGFEPLRLSGEVCWVKAREISGWDIGIQFHRVELMRLQRLFRFSTEF